MICKHQAAQTHRAVTQVRNRFRQFRHLRAGRPHFYPGITFKISWNNARVCEHRQLRRVHKQFKSGNPKLNGS